MGIELRFDATQVTVTTDYGEVTLDTTIPPPEIMASWREFLAAQSPAMRALVAKYDINPGGKYAIAEQPERAVFYRVAGGRVCQSRNMASDPEPHLHVSLVAHTHDGTPFAMLEDIKADELTAYAYSPANPPTLASLEEELVVIDRIKELEAVSGGEPVHIELDAEESDDPLLDAIAAADPLAGAVSEDERWQ